MHYPDHDLPLFGKQQDSGIEPPICSNTSPFHTCLVVVTALLTSLVMGCGQAGENGTAAKPPGTGQPDIDGQPAKQTNGDSEPATSQNGDSGTPPPTQPPPNAFLVKRLKSLDKVTDVFVEPHELQMLHQLLAKERVTLWSTLSDAQVVLTAFSLKNDYAL